MDNNNKPWVKEIGGIFFKTKDPKMIWEWYEKHLGIRAPDEFGGMFEWRKTDESDKKAYIELREPVDEEFTKMYPNCKTTY